MPSSFQLNVLQWALVLSGVLAFVLSGASWIAALRERHALAWAKTNGALSAAALLHLVTASTRLIAATISIAGGIALLVLPDFAISSGVLAGICWLAYNLLMATNLSIEWWARMRMARSLATTDRLTLVNELAMQRVERTAERLERTAERLELAHEREARP